MGRHDRRTAGRMSGLAGQCVDAGDRERHRRQGRPSEFPLHRARLAVPHHRPGLGIADGVPISAIIFGGRRATTMPLVYQAFNWSSGVYIGATMGSETTAAAAGAVGKVRRDPMAMLPFCGYHMGDYFRHWLKLQRASAETPADLPCELVPQRCRRQVHLARIRENMRVLKWIVDRAHGRAKGKETPIGWMPRLRGYRLDRPGLSEGAVRRTTGLRPRCLATEIIGHEELFIDLHDHLPPEIVYERELLICRL